MPWVPVDQMPDLRGNPALSSFIFEKLVCLEPKIFQHERLQKSPRRCKGRGRSARGECGGETRTERAALSLDSDRRDHPPIRSVRLPKTYLWTHLLQVCALEVPGQENRRLTLQTPVHRRRARTSPRDNAICRIDTQPSQRIRPLDRAPDTSRPPRPTKRRCPFTPRQGLCHPYAIPGARLPRLRNPLQHPSVRATPSLDLGLRDTQVPTSRSRPPRPDRPPDHLECDLPAPGERGLPRVEGGRIEAIYREIRRHQ